MTEKCYVILQHFSAYETGFNEKVNVERVFKSLEEAQRECKEYNKQESFGVVMEENGYELGDITDDEFLYYDIEESEINKN